MFWDKVAGLYDFFMKFKNGRVNKQLCFKVVELIDQNDRVLECACGTGMISEYVGRKCRELVATDFSNGMLRQARKKCRKLENIKIEQADITQLKYDNDSFDKVVAGNVIHLLDDPQSALLELERVCKAGGKIIIPTYVNHENEGKPGVFVKVIEKLGVGFKCQFNFETYKCFFENNGYEENDYFLIKGSMPCAIAIITKR